MHVVVVGGGASGVFAAIQCKLANPNIQVSILEKTNQLLQKVKVSGGGRCNVTHNTSSIAFMHKCYPRGGKQLKKLFGQFFTTDTIRYFAERGVKLKAEADGRMFPTSDSSQTIINCFLADLEKLQIGVSFDTRVKSITQRSGNYVLDTNNGELKAQRVILATGGSPNEKGLAWLGQLGYAIAKPIPSLFTFNLRDKTITALKGISVPDATVKIEGFNDESTGPLLITHWGLSGPAVLRLSAYAARFLHEKEYRYRIAINWLGTRKEHELRAAWNDEVASLAKTQVVAKNPFDIPTRLWSYLCARVGLNSAFNWSNLPKKEKNKLIQVLVNDAYDCQGKTTFKEEFVTAGGVSWESINVKTMESKIHPGLFFCGELIDMDGITGGFNFQAAWTTGYVAGINAGKL